MKDELWCISAPAAAASLTAPDQAAPWPSPQEGPPTGRYGAHTGSRTTSALRRSSARPAEKSGTSQRCHGCTHFIIWTLAMEKKRHKENKETEAGLSAPERLRGHATCSLHLDFLPHWDSKLLLSSGLENTSPYRDTQHAE